MGDDAWFRSVLWSAEEAAQFEARLGRAREHNRPQYLRIKGLALASSGDPELRVVGRQLLERVVETYPDQRDAIDALAHLADSYCMDGDHHQAAASYRECLSSAENSRYGADAVAHVVIRLAQLVVERGWHEQYQEMLGLIGGEQFRRKLVLRNLVFDWAVLQARLRSAIGVARVAEFALLALELAASTTPQFPRHPDVAWVDADGALIRELTKLAET